MKLTYLNLQILTVKCSESKTNKRIHLHIVSTNLKNEEKKPTRKMQNDGGDYQG
jgi:hypothetical protein